MQWQPNATISSLQQRAEILQKIRAFFAARGVWEVETPLLCATTVPDIHLASFQTLDQRYLQTSPEYAMKRLLAAGSGAIYQISKAFRAEECGKNHNPEFTMLEWYRPDYDHHQLMQEVDALLQTILQTPPAIRYSYRELFTKTLGVDPLTESAAGLQACASQQGISLSDNIDHTQRDTWLELLMTHILEPKLGFSAPVFVYDYPASQAALARIRDDDPPVAERFEVYVNGIELANGYYELADVNEQRRRFMQDLQKRQAAGLMTPPLDERLLAALESGLPNCAGIALGIDRLIMLALQSENINDVLSFNWENA